eukprot:Hpha_TRINITY_DN4024_c0_g1::TRINITY_DN4024_c0_g1_i1::g.63679::m.63679
MAGTIYVNVEELRKLVWRELKENLILYVFPTHLKHPRTGPRLFAFARHGPAVLDARTVSAVVELGVSSLPLPLQAAEPRIVNALAQVLNVKPTDISDISFEGTEIRPCTAVSSRGTESNAVSKPAVSPPAPGREPPLPGVKAQLKKAEDGNLGLHFSQGRVTGVSPGGLADKSGVATGRLVVRVNGKRVDGDEEIAEAIATSAADVLLEAVPTIRCRVTRPGGSLDAAVCPASAAAAIGIRLEKDAARGRQGMLSSAGFEVLSVRVCSASAFGGAASVTPYPPIGKSGKSSTTRRGGPVTVLRNTEGCLKLPAYRRHKRASGPMGDIEEGLVLKDEEETFLGELYCRGGKGLPTPSDVQAAREMRDPRVDTALSFSILEVQELCRAAQRSWRERLKCHSVTALAVAAAVNLIVSAAAVSPPLRRGVAGSPGSPTTAGMVPPAVPTETIVQMEDPAEEDMGGVTLTSTMRSVFSYTGVKSDEGLAVCRRELDELVDGLNKGERTLLRKERQGVFTAIGEAIVAERKRRLQALALATPQEAGRPSFHGIRRDDSVTRSRQTRFYGRSLPTPHSLNPTPETPADTLRLLHKTLSRITDPGAGTAASDLTLNSKLVRHDYHPNAASDIAVQRRDGEELGVTLTGTRVAKVSPGSAAEAAGIRKGDVITAVEGVRVLSQVDAATALTDVLLPQTFNVAVVRGGREAGVKEGRGWDGYCCVRGNGTHGVVQGIPSKWGSGVTEATEMQRSKARAMVRESAAEQSRSQAHQRRIDLSASLSRTLH